MIDAPERNFSARVAYDGTAYAGFQLQPNEPTVQGELEKALAKVLGGEIRVHAASRTDAGVHSLGQVMSFHNATSLPAEEIEKAVNALLSSDIRIGPMVTVSERDIRSWLESIPVHDHTIERGRITSSYRREVNVSAGMSVEEALREWVGLNPAFADMLEEMIEAAQVVEAEVGGEA